MIEARSIKRRVLAILRLRIASPAERGVRAQRSSTRTWAGRWRGACALARLIDDRSGATMVIVGLALPVLLGFAALGIEVGIWYETKRTMQGAADSAVWSAAIAKNRPPGTSSIITAQAKSVAANYHYVDGSAGVTVAVNNPPKSGTYTTNAFALEVTIQQPQTALFSPLFMASPPTVGARAVALLTNGSNCIYALAPSGSGALHVEGGDDITSACGVGVNSNSPTAITVSGKLTAPSVNIVGGYSGPITSPKITSGVLPISDPLFYLTPPTWTPGTCNKTNYSVGSGVVTLNPGVYCGGITISGSAVVTFNPGNYILLGGGFTTLGTSVVNGTGVTFYNTASTVPSRPYTPLQVGLDNSVVKLTAPTSGNLQGILFFQDRSIVSSADNVLNGSFTGAIYLPTTPLVMQSGSSVSVAYTILVAKTVSLAVNTLKVNSDYSSLTDGSPIKEPKLVE
jgi:Flp pilus assembly protein TadG